VVEGAGLESSYSSKAGRGFESHPLRQFNFGLLILDFGLLEASEAERDRRAAVMGAILEHTRANRTIKLPPFDPSVSEASPEFALQSVGIEPNPFGGTVGRYRYQFEGEEDLLHLIVTRIDGGALGPEEGQAVAAFLFQGVPPALIWLKPGEVSQHFYVGHDDLMGT
jgi:hypothetical protein